MKGIRALCSTLRDTNGDTLLRPDGPLASEEMASAKDGMLPQDKFLDFLRKAVRSSRTKVGCS